MNSNRIFAFLFTSLSVCSSSGQQYDKNVQYEIAQLRFCGNQFTSPDFLMSVLDLQVGDRINLQSGSLAQGIRRLWDREIVNDISVSLIKVEGEKAWLLVEIQELPRLEELELKGLKKSYRQELEAELIAFKGRVLSPANLKKIDNTIPRFLGDKGYPEPSILTRTRNSILVDNSVYLTVEVDKGPRLRTSIVEFKGNNQLCDRDLKKALASSSGFFRRSKYAGALHREDQENLEEAYREKGYLDAQVSLDTIIRIRPRRAKVVYQVEEGERYYLGKITWKGNTLFSSEQLSKALYLDPGDVFNPQLLHKRLYFDPGAPDISSLYLDKGYMFLSIDPVRTSSRNDTIDLEIRISEGKQAIIGDVRIQGNVVTRDHVVRREIRTLPGNVFSRADMMRSQRELAQLGYFDPARLNVTPSPNPQTGLVDLNYSVVEQSSDEFLFSGGWGGAYGFIGSAGIALNNFSARDITDLSKWRPYPLGNGQKLAFRLQSNGRGFQNYSLSFSEPWFQGKPHVLSFNLTHSTQSQEYTTQIDDQEDLVQTGKLKLSGGTVSLTRRLKWPDDYFTLTHGISYYNYRFDNYQSALSINNGSSNNLSFFTTLARNSIDNPNFPRMGSLLSINFEVTPPHSAWNHLDSESSSNYAWLEYYKAMFDYRKYQRVVGNLVLEMRAHAGLLGSYGSQGVGPFERFYLGGSGLGGQDIVLGNDVIGLRGYPDNSLVPTDPDGIEGGVLYHKFVMELRYPIIEKPWGTAYVLGFAEAGNNWAQFSDYKPFDLKRSVGVGVRFILPGLGQIGLDWANGFDPLTGTTDPDGSQLHISVGRQIR